MEDKKISEEKKIKVERETYNKEDKTYFSYFIKGVIRGREVRIAVVPPDNGGFRVLDIVFDKEMSADLVLKPYEIKDDKGKVLKGNTYAVVSKDKDGTEYECPVKPARASDKIFLKMLDKNKKDVII